jgi:hypothetical protein
MVLLRGSKEKPTRWFPTNLQPYHFLPPLEEDYKNCNLMTHRKKTQSISTTTNVLWTRAMKTNWPCLVREWELGVVLFNEANPKPDFRK